MASDKALVELCEKLCQDREIRVIIERECPTHVVPNWKSSLQHNLNLGIEYQEAVYVFSTLPLSRVLNSPYPRFLHQLDLLLGHCTSSNKDILHMIYDERGRNRTILELGDVRDKYSVQMTSIISHHQQHTRRTLAEVDHVFYVVSLCSYCRMLSGCSFLNEMEASLRLFSLMSNMNVMRTTPITIFFTQADIFPQRIVDVPVAGYFRDYKYGADATAAFAYFASKFQRWDCRQNAQLHLFAPGLCGSASLQDNLNKVEDRILCDLRDR